MNSKQISGIVLVVIGVGMLFTSHYIQGQVAEGNAKISSAQRKVDSGSSLFSLTPVTKEVGKGISGSAQKKIDAGKEEVSKYTQIAQALQIGGIIAIIIGAILFFLGRSRRGSRS